METEILKIQLLEKLNVQEEVSSLPVPREKTVGEQRTSSCCTPKNQAAACCSPSQSKEENNGACCAQPKDGSLCCDKLPSLQEVQ